MTDEPKRRLVVELSKRTAVALAKLSEREQLNKTTIVNRAIQVYELVTDTQESGGVVLFEDRNGETVRMVLL